MELFENVPKFYSISASEAREQNLMDEWRKSHAVNHDCQVALGPKVGAANNPDEMQAALLWGAQQYGLERIIALLTITVQHLEYDGRIDRRHKEWASQFDFSALENTGYLGLNSHATRINYAMEYIINAHNNLKDPERMLNLDTIFDIFDEPTRVQKQSDKHFAEIYLEGDSLDIEEMEDLIPLPGESQFVIDFFQQHPDAVILGIHFTNVRHNVIAQCREALGNSSPYEFSLSLNECLLQERLSDNGEENATLVSGYIPASEIIHDALEQEGEIER